METRYVVYYKPSFTAHITFKKEDKDIWNYLKTMLSEQEDADGIIITETLSPHLTEDYTLISARLTEALPDLSMFNAIWIEDTSNNGTIMDGHIQAIAEYRRRQ